MAEESPGLVYQSFFSDRKADFLYVLAVAKGLDRAEIFRRAEILLVAGLAHRRKREGMVIVDREGKGYEVIQAAIPEPSPEALAAGESLFGHLKVTDTAIRLLPG